MNNDNSKAVFNSTAAFNSKECGANIGSTVAELLKTTFTGVEDIQSGEAVEIEPSDGYTSARKTEIQMPDGETIGYMEIHERGHDLRTKKALVRMLNYGDE